MREPPSIDAWGGGGFRVSGVWRPGSLLILGDRPTSWRPAHFDELTVVDFAAMIAAGAAVSEFVILGAGERQALPPRDIQDALALSRIGLEFMSSAAAARLHNVLAAEGRRFATALIAV